MAEPVESTRLWEVERTYVYTTPADGPVTLVLPGQIKAPDVLTISGLTYMLDSEATFKLRAWIRNKSEWAVRERAATK